MSFIEERGELVFFFLVNLGWKGINDGEIIEY